jgi:hypothetical protein
MVCLPRDPDVYLPPIVKVSSPGWDLERFSSLLQEIARLKNIAEEPCVSGEDALCIHCQALDALERLENEAQLSMEDIRLSLDETDPGDMFEDDFELFVD